MTKYYVGNQGCQCNIYYVNKCERLEGREREKCMNREAEERKREHGGRWNF
jgi:hypothetical protein